MSAVMGTRPGPAQGAPAPATVAGPVTQVRVVRAEWTKLRALRSTRWCGLSAIVLIVGLGAAIAGSGTLYHVSAGNHITGFAPYLPSNAGGALWGNPVTTAHALGPWTGFAVLCGYAVVLTALAAWRLRRCDA